MDRFSYFMVRVRQAPARFELEGVVEHLDTGQKGEFNADAELLTFVRAASFRDKLGSETPPRHPLDTGKEELP
jgi:hypothetical protein